jgi:hypothetical protein
MARTRKQPDPVAVFTVRLVDDVASAQFHLDGAEVELDEKNPTLELTDERVYRQLLELPFLQAAG